MKKILIVDNIKSEVEKETGLFNREAFKIFEASTGEEAIAVHRREKVDIILMDLHLPKMSGEEVCRAIRNDPTLKDVSILLVTAMNDPQEVERCKSAGANGTIKKPIDRDELASDLAKLLGIPARQSIRILVKVRIDGLHGTEFFIANTVDVSVSGLLFECDRELDLGETVEASFFLPATNNYNRVVAKAEVVRSVVSEGTYRRYGVRFVDFKEGNSDIISEFIFKKTGKS